jgi:glycosyltransferase involved in cell wall biosynthesis
MNVAVVHNFHSSAVPSGEDEVVVAEVAALRRAGLDVSLFAVSNDELAGTPLAAMRAAVTVATGIGVSPADDLARFRPDVVHVHSPFPYVGSRWLRHVGAPLVVTAHSYRAMCANGYLFRSGDVCTRCVNGRSWSSVRFGCYRGSRLASLPHAIGTRRGAAHDRLFSAADRVLVLSERSRDLFVQAGVDERKLRLDDHFVPDSARHGSVSKRRADTWLFVGRLSPEKGIDRLVDEWPPDEPLRVIGDGPLRPALERASARKMIDFVGQCPRAQVLTELREAFGLVFPSRWYETFGLAYIEALSAGVPTMAFRPNVVADAIDRDTTGIVAAWEHLGGAVTRARREFDARREHCLQVFEERYSERAFIARRRALYEELMR